MYSDVNPVLVFPSVTLVVIRPLFGLSDSMGIIGSCMSKNYQLILFEMRI